LRGQEVSPQISAMLMEDWLFAGTPALPGVFVSANACCSAAPSAVVRVLPAARSAAAFQDLVSVLSM